MVLRMLWLTGGVKSEPSQADRSIMPSGWDRLIVCSFEYWITIGIGRHTA
jgi:hypothetical protein